MRNVYFIGIGGIGMSALARYYRSQGWKVTGSDAAHSSIIKALRAEGIAVRIGHRALHLPRATNRVIVSLAVEKKNPELARAQQLKIPVFSYAEAIGELTHRYTTIAISGSHGKSTTTALVGLILTRAGFDPTVIVGTNLREFGNINFRAGKSEYLVLEADEWGKSFHHYSPQIAVITNMDKEHLDIYKTYAGVVKGFVRYLNNVLPGGTVVANGGDKGVRQAVRELRSKNKEVRIIWYNRKGIPAYSLGIPGRHNQENAEAAWQVAKQLGISKRVVSEVFRKYKGSWRRFEQLPITNYQLPIRSILYTDYAHHPTEIRATLEATRERYPKKKIICVFEPHQADRLTRLFNEFLHAFDMADETVILPVYRVIGREKKAHEKTSRDLVREAKKEGMVYRKNLGETFRYLTPHLKNPQSVIIFMSAGSLDAEVRRFVNNE